MRAQASPANHELREARSHRTGRRNPHRHVVCPLESEHQDSQHSMRKAVFGAPLQDRDGLF
jgi:hypothetical protein